MKAQNSDKVLAKRKQLSVSEYEHILDSCASMDLEGARVCEPGQWNLSKRFLYLGTKGNKRVYSDNGKVVIN